MTDESKELHGTLKRVRSVGYRSPYRLETEDGEVELRGCEEGLEEHVGRAVTVRGEHVERSTGPAAPGTEAATRFVGPAPVLRWFEVSGIVV